MKLSEYRKTYYDLSGKTSDIARQLAFAGIALVWLFKQDTKPIPTIPKPLLLPTALLACALASDLLHYAIATLIWGNFQWRKEKDKNVDEDPNLSAPRYYNYPALTFFTAKLLFVIIAYLLIISYIFYCWY